MIAGLTINWPYIGWAFSESKNQLLHRPFASWQLYFYKTGNLVIHLFLR